MTSEQFMTLVKVEISLYYAHESLHMGMQSRSFHVLQNIIKIDLTVDFLRL